MRKAINIVWVVILLFFTFTYPLAQTIDDVQKEGANLAQQRESALNDLRNKEMNLRDIINQVAQATQEKITLEGQQASIENNMYNINQEINATQDKIAALKDRANATLAFYQQVHNVNPLIEELFGNKNDTSGYEEAIVTNTIIEAGMESINEALSLQTHLNEQKVMLDKQQQELETKLVDIKHKEDELNILKVKVENEAQNAEVSYNSAQTALLANQRLESLMQQAGCKPGEVYGIDCGKTITSTGSFMRPVSYGMVTCEYMGYTNHTGIDIGQNGSGGPVYAVAPGEVIAAGNNIISGGGNQVLILHNYNGQQVITSYCHLSQINVSEGSIVTPDTQIGLVGETGKAFGPHLHFEVSYGAYGWRGGSFVNPRQFVDFPPEGVWFNTR